MNRRQYLAAVGAAGATGTALLAGCSDDQSDGSGNEGQNDGGQNGNGASGTGGANAGDGGAGTPAEQVGDAATDGEALDTGQAPDDSTGTPFENTNTVPEVDGLETGQAPNRTADESG